MPSPAAGKCYKQGDYRREFEQCNRVETTQAAITIANTMAVTAAIGSLVSQDSGNDVRIFQLVQECEFNGSPSADVTEDSNANPLVVAMEAKQHQRRAENECQERCAEPLPHSVQLAAKDKCSSQQYSHSRATIKDTQSSGHSPVNSLHTVARVAATECKRPTINHHSEICTVVDSQHGVGAFNVSSGDDVGRIQAANDSELQQSSLKSWNGGAHAVTDAAASAPEQEKQAAPDACEHRHAPPGVSKETSEAVHVSAERAVRPEVGHQADFQVAAAVAGEAMEHQNHISDTEHVHVQEEEEHQEDELDDILPTQIDGIKCFMSAVDAMEALKPVEALPDEPDKEGAATGVQTPSVVPVQPAEGDATREVSDNRGESEKPVIDSCVTLSCVVSDSVNASPLGVPCSLPLPDAGVGLANDHADSVAVSQQHSVHRADLLASPSRDKLGTQHELQPGENAVGGVATDLENIRAPLEPRAQEMHDSPTKDHTQRDVAQLDTLAKENALDEHADNFPVAREGSDLEGHVDQLQQTNFQDCNRKADPLKQMPGGVRSAVPEHPHVLVTCSRPAMQPTASAPGAPAAFTARPDTVGAAPAVSEGDGTVCDSGDACMDDDAHVESPPAPNSKAVREKQCMSDTIQDTRTLCRPSGPNEPESQQTVRQKQAPATLQLIMQQSAGCQQATPDMFGGHASAQIGVAKPAKSRGGALVAAVIGAPEKSTGTVGDMLDVRPTTALGVKAWSSPAPTAPPSNAPGPPQPRSRHDRVHSKRAAHAQHDARIHKAAGAAACLVPQGPASGQGGKSLFAAPHSRSPSPLPRCGTTTPPRSKPGSAARSGKGGGLQHMPSPLPKGPAVRLPRSDLGACRPVHMRSPDPSVSHRPATPEHTKGGSRSHSRSPSMFKGRSGDITPGNSTPMKGGHAPTILDQVAAAAQGEQADVPAVQISEAPRANSDGQRVQQVLAVDNTNVRKPPDPVLTDGDTLKTAKPDDRPAEQTSTGPVHVSRTCVMTDSQLSLQNWMEEPAAGRHQQVAPQRSPPRFPKSPPREPPASVAPTTGGDSDDDFDELAINASRSRAAGAAPAMDSEKEELEWIQFKQRRSCGKPSHILDSQNAVNFLADVLAGAPAALQARSLEDTPLAERGNRTLPQAGGRRVKNQSAPGGACTGESSGAQAAPCLRIPRIAVASQQGSQDIQCSGVDARKHSDSRKGRHSAPVATRSPLVHGADSAQKQHRATGAGGRKSRSPCHVEMRAVHAAAYTGSNAATCQGASDAVKQPLRDSGNIPAGSHAKAQKFAQDSDREYKCKQDPVHSADRSPRRSARIAQHNIVPAADADKALANLSQMCMLSQAGAHVEAPCCPGVQRPKLELNHTSARGDPQHVDRKVVQSSPLQKKRKLSTEPTPLKATGTDEDQQQRARRRVDANVTAQAACTPGIQPQRAAASPTAAPPARRPPTTPERTHNTHPQRSKPSLQHRPAGSAREAHTTPTRCAKTEASPPATKQAARGRTRCSLEWQQPAVQTTSWKAFYDGVCGSGIGRISCGDVVAVETAGRQVMIQVKRMWENLCSKEKCVSGPRLYQLQDTPAHIFAPDYVDKKQCVALGDDVYTFEAECIVHKLPVLFVGEGKGFTSEAEAKRLTKHNRDALFCRLAVQDSGGALPLQL